MAQAVDVLSKVLRSVELAHECEHSPRVFNRLEVGRNLLINIVGRFTAFVSILGNGKPWKDSEATLNTLCNLANSIIELRNIVRELLDESCIQSSTSARGMLERLFVSIDCIGLKVCAISLSLLGSMPSGIPANMSGKIASALASLMFASLLNMHASDVKSVLNNCYGLNAPIHVAQKSSR